MNVRRAMWVLLIVSGAVIIGTMYYGKRMEQTAATAAATPATVTPPPPGEVARGAGGGAALTLPSPEGRGVTTSAAPPAATPPAGAPAEAPLPPPAAADKAQPAAPVTWSQTRYEAPDVLLGSLDRASGYRIQVQLTNRGAAVYTLKLAEHFATYKDKRAYEKDPAGYERALASRPDLLGHYSLLNPVDVDGPIVYPMETYQLELRNCELEAPDTRNSFDDAPKLPFDLSGPRWGPGPVEPTPAGDGQQVTFTSVIKRNGQPFITLRKTYSVRRGSYSVGIQLQAVNESGQEQVIRVRQAGPTGVPREDVQGDKRALVYAVKEEGNLKIYRPGAAELLKLPVGLDKAKAPPHKKASDPIVWLGQTNKFFASLLYVLPEPAAATQPATTQATAPATAETPPKLVHDPLTFLEASLAETPTSHTYAAAVHLGPYALPKAEPKTQTEPGKTYPVAVDMDLFAGPKERDLFEREPLYAQLAYRESMDVGSCCGSFLAGPMSGLARGMMWLLVFLGKHVTFNYGLAIIVLVLLVRAALHPLTKKSQVSMMGMQKLQPRMAEIREKYKDDKARQNQETMKLYKTAGFSPVLGCLPMFLQMPIWVALWQGLQAAVELRHASFLPIWLTDLAGPDALFIWGNPFTMTHWPMVGPLYALNLLPILLGIAMFLQQKLTPQTPPAVGARGGSDQQAMMQKQMMYMMPVMMLLIFYNAPSGLTLYIMASTFGGIIEQMVIKKHIRQKQAAEAAAETKVSMPGKIFRSQRPKKPKGPFRF